MNTEDANAIADAIESLASSVHVQTDPPHQTTSLVPVICLSDAVSSIAWELKAAADAIERLAIAVEDMRKGGDA